MVIISTAISGGGTTAGRIFDECNEGVLKGKARVGAVIASAPDIGGIQRALDAGIDRRDILVCHHRDFATRREFGEAIIEFCRARGVEFFGQYGWMLKTPANVINEFAGMIANQHPGPTDVFGGVARAGFGGKGMYGLRVHDAVLRFSRKINRPFTQTWATAHHVIEEYDKGKIIAVSPVPIAPDDTAESLQQRVLPFEHDLQVRVLLAFANGRVPLFERAEPLIREEELEALEQAKAEAIAAFP